MKQLGSKLFLALMFFTTLCSYKLFANEFYVHADNISQNGEITKYATFYLFIEDASEIDRLSFFMAKGFMDEIDDDMFGKEADVSIADLNSEAMVYWYKLDNELKNGNYTFYVKAKLKDGDFLNSNLIHLSIFEDHDHDTIPGGKEYPIDLFAKYDYLSKKIDFYWTLPETEYEGDPAFKFWISKEDMGHQDGNKELLKEIEFGDAENKDGAFYYSIEKELTEDMYFAYVSAHYSKDDVLYSVPCPIIIEGGGHNWGYVQFKSEPGFEAFVGEEYTYDADAVYTLGNAKEFKYSLSDAPDGMTIDEASGLVKWEPESPGYYFTTITATLKDDPSVTGRQYLNLLVHKCKEPGKIVIEVVNKDGEAIENGFVNIMSANEDDEMGGILWQHMDDEDGKDTIYLPGKYTYFVDGGEYYVAFNDFYGGLVWYENAETMEEATKVIVDCGETVTVNFVIEELDFEEYTVRGKVTDEDGAPVKYASIYFSTYDNSSADSLKEYNKFYRSFFAMSDENGEYSVELPNITSYRASCFAMDYDGFCNTLPLYYNQTYNPEEAEEIVLTADRDNVNFVIGKNPDFNYVKASGYVKYDDDTPIEGAIVSFEGFNNKQNDYFYKFKSETTTEADGSFEVEIPDGFKYKAWAYANNKDFHNLMFYNQTFNPEEAEVIEFDGDKDDINFIFEAGSIPDNDGSISGSVKDTDGKKLRQVHVEAFKLFDGDTILYDNLKGRMSLSDEDGKFEIKDLESGSYLLFAMPLIDKYLPGFYVANDVAETDWSKATRIELSDDNKSISGIIIKLGEIEESTGDGQIGGIVKADNNGSRKQLYKAAITLENSLKNKIAKFEQSNLDGSFRINSLAKGNYKLTVNKPGYKDYTNALEIKSSEILDLGDIILEPMSVNEVEEEIDLFDVSVFPNPVSEKLVVNFSANTNSMEVSIINTAGEVLSSETIATVIGDNTYKYRINNLTSGMYFIQLRGVNYNKMVPFIVNR